MNINFRKFLLITGLIVVIAPENTPVEADTSLIKILTSANCVLYDENLKDNIISYLTIPDIGRWRRVSRKFRESKVTVNQLEAFLSNMHADQIKMKNSYDHDALLTYMVAQVVKNMGKFARMCKIANLQRYLVIECSEFPQVFKKCFFSDEIVNIPSDRRRYKESIDNIDRLCWDNKASPQKDPNYEYLPLVNLIIDNTQTSSNVMYKIMKIMQLTDDEQTNNLIQL